MSKQKITSESESASAIYVSPQGNDRWSGHLPEPNKARNDGPLATLPMAQRKVRGLLKATKRQAAIRVILRGGRYELKQPLVFNEQDSGLPLAPRLQSTVKPAHPVYCAYAGETPVISAGRRIGGWKIKTVAGRKVWVAHLPDVKKGKWYFHQLWVDGQRRFRPRLPRKGHYRIADVLGANYEGGWNETVRKGSNRFVYAAGDLKPWRNLTDVEICAVTLWVEQRMWIESLDEKHRIVHLDRTSDYRLTDDGGPAGALYVVDNVFEELNEPGQWYLDRGEGKLYYLSMPGETPEQTEVIAPALTEVVRIEGRADRSVESLAFEGLTFAHNEWELPKNMAGSEQAAVDVPGALVLRHARNCWFDRCNIKHVGTYGLELAENCSDILFRGGEISDLGAGGVKIWHGCCRNIVSDNEIYAGGQRFISAEGVLVGKASGNQILHNHVHGFFHIGISVGWVWGYGENACGNIVEWNHVHDIGKFVLNDLGGIYTLGVQPGTRVRYNLVHDVNARKYGAQGIYTDEGSSDILVENNIVYRVGSAGFNHHYGRNNIVRNNIFACGCESSAGEAQIQRGDVEHHFSFVFERNIVFYEDEKPLLAGRGIWQTAPDNVMFRHNLYWRKGGPIVCARGPMFFGLRAFSVAGFAGEAPRFDTVLVVPGAQGPGKSMKPASRALGQIPSIRRPDGMFPPDSVWKDALRLPDLVAPNGKAVAGGCANVRLLRDDRFLYVDIFCRRLRGSAITGRHGPAKEQGFAEVFLVPDIARKTGVQFHLDEDGAKYSKNFVTGDMLDLPWDAAAHKTGKTGAWRALFRITLAELTRYCGGATPAWGIYISRKAPNHIFDFREWRATGMDRDSVIADPLFKDPRKGDFTLGKRSPARKIGFVPLDLALVGPRPELAQNGRLTREWGRPGKGCPAGISGAAKRKP